MTMPIQDTDVWTLARTCYGEARGEGFKGMVAVAHVVMNRVARSGKHVAEVCQAPKQFSCWNQNDPNALVIQTLTPSQDEEPPAFLRALAAAALVLAGDMKDPTGGATHYHAEGISPTWAVGQTPSAKIGRHVFYNTVR